MDCNECNSLFHLVEEGDLEGIKLAFSRLNEAEIGKCLRSSFVNGSTPLIVAARYGHTEIVEYLLSLKADPSECGTVFFDGETILRVPPLWAAAAAGHLSVCKLLVEQNVDVNQTSSTNSTPLRGACYDGHIEIVKYLVDHGADIEIPNHHGHTALMISCYRGKKELVEYLLGLGALVNRRSSKGNTALHDTAEIGHTEILRMLLAAGAKLAPDDYGVTPLLITAMHGQRDALILLSAYSTKNEQRNAWKLMGATMVDRRNDLGFAVVCWRTAYSDFLPSPPDMEDVWTLPEVDDLPQLDDVQQRVYGGYSEARCLRDVDALAGDPDAIRMQALLIRQRILGESHPETHYYLRLRGAFFCDFGRWDRCFDFWMYILQLEQYYMPPLSLPTTSAFVAFADTLSAIIDMMVLQNDRSSATEHENRVTLEQIIVVIERALYEAERYMRSDEEPELDPFDNIDIRQETENLLHIILHYLHLANRAYFLGTSREERLSRALRSARLTNANQHYSSGAVRPPAGSVDTSPSTSSGYYSGGASPDRLLMINATPSTPNMSTLTTSSVLSSPVSSLASTSSLGSRQLSSEHCRSSRTHADDVPYVFYSTFGSVDRMPPLCERAYPAPLTSEIELEQKAVFPLKPKCSNLRCLVRRTCAIFDMLKISALHMACTQSERCEIRRAPSRFVIEKLLEIGADVRQVDDFDNTALHVLLSNESVSPCIVKQLLDAGVPLLARNMFNETCLDLIVKKSPSLIERLHIGRYLSLKQIAANVVMRHLSGTKTFEDILPKKLEKFIAIF